MYVLSADAETGGVWTCVGNVRTSRGSEAVADVSQGCIAAHMTIPVAA